MIEISSADGQQFKNIVLANEKKGLHAASLPARANSKANTAIPGTNAQVDAVDA